MPLVGECHQLLSLTALSMIYNHLLFVYFFIGYSSVLMLDCKVPKGKVLDYFIHDDWNTGYMRVSIVCNELNGDAWGWKYLFSSWPFILESKLCCDTNNNLKLWGIWRWLCAKLNFEASLLISWKLNGQF